MWSVIPKTCIRQLLHDTVPHIKLHYNFLWFTTHGGRLAGSARYFLKRNFIQWQALRHCDVVSLQNTDVYFIFNFGVGIKAILVQTIFCGNSRESIAVEAKSKLMFFFVAKSSILIVLKFFLSIVQKKQNPRKKCNKKIIGLHLQSQFLLFAWSPSLLFNNATLYWNED